jgi:hypothetical protein
MLEQLLAKGAVFAGRFQEIDHEKYFIIVGITKDKIRCCSVFINSNIPSFIFRNQSLLSLQVNIQGFKYNFLTHDSFVSCNNIKELSIAYLQNCRYIGKIDDDDFGNIITTLLNSDTLSEKDREMFF